MVTKRTPLHRRSLQITDEMIDAFLTIRREYKGAIEEKSDKFLDAFTRLHMLLNLYPCTPSPALCPGPEPKGANEFIAACYAESWAMRLKIEEDIAARRRTRRSRVKPIATREPAPP